MSSKKIEGTVKSENVIWFVVVSLLIGFIGGVAFGIYKSGRLAAPVSMGGAQAMNAELQANIDAFKARTSENPKDAEAWVQLGHLYFDAGQAEQSIEAYEKALAIQPQNANVWTDLGVMYRRSGEPEKAVAAFDRAMQIDPDHEISRFNKGIVLFHDLKDEEGAIKAWESLLAINPDAQSPGGRPVRELADHIVQEHRSEK
jgi:cytochrome c-type biogenesis protein CcmH/NrfG